MFSDETFAVTLIFSPLYIMFLFLAGCLDVFLMRSQQFEYYGPICFSLYYCLRCSMLLESVMFYLALILEKSQQFSSNIFSLLFSLLLSPLHLFPLPLLSLLLPFPLSSSLPPWGSNYVYFR